MGSLVNIIHPYTYRTIEDNGIDYKVVDFLKSALENESKLINYGVFRDNSFKSAFINCIDTDEVFGEIFRDKRVDNYLTMANGLPRCEERPEKVGRASWDEMQKNIISHSSLQRKTEGFSNLFFIGGFFERCLGTAAFYFARNVQNGEKLYCIEDLSISLVPEEKEKMEKIFNEENIKMINSEEALKLLN